MSRSSASGLVEGLGSPSAHSNLLSPNATDTDSLYRSSRWNNTAKKLKARVLTLAKFMSSSKRQALSDTVKDEEAGREVEAGILVAEFWLEMLQESKASETRVSVFDNFLDGSRVQWFPRRHPRDFLRSFLLERFGLRSIAARGLLHLRK